MNQLFKRVNRRKSSRTKAGQASENVSSGSLAPPQPVPEGSVPGKVKGESNVDAPSTPKSSRKPTIRGWISHKLHPSAGASTTSTSMSTSSRRIPSSKTTTPLPRTPETEPSHTPEDPLHSLKSVASASARCIPTHTTNALTSSTTTPTRNRPLATHSDAPHSSPTRRQTMPSQPQSQQSALASSLKYMLVHDPLVRWALEETADASRDGVDKDNLDINDPAYVRSRVHRAAAALDKSGNILFEQGEYDQAFERYSKALTLKKQTVSSSFQLLQPLDPEGDHQNQGQNEQNGGDQGAEDQQRNDQDKVMASLATSINNTALLAQRAGHASPDETMASYLKSLQIKRDILGPDDLSVGKTLNNIGSVFYLKREFEPALAAYKDACRIMTARLGSEHLDVGTVICNIGDVYCATGGRNEEALEQYRRALPIRWKSLGPNDPKVVRLMEQISSLEMGRHPLQKEDFLPEECFAEEDNYFNEEDNVTEFKTDLRTLQRELEEDMKYFDLMQREAEIDMVKDKTRVFRELRELSNPPLVENEKAELPGYALSDELQQQAELQHPTPSLTTPVENASKSFEQILATPLETASTSVPQIETDHVPSTAARRASLLSSEQRHEALTSVRDRLSKIRSTRDSLRSEPVGVPALPTTKPIGRRAYMEPTESSFAKILGVPERQKVDEGIDNLRNAPTRWTSKPSTITRGTTVQ
jgi:tetratricopeptide (TPR) repeat protein